MVTSLNSHAHVIVQPYGFPQRTVGHQGLQYCTTRHSHTTVRYPGSRRRTAKCFPHLYNRPSRLSTLYNQVWPYHCTAPMVTSLYNQDVPITVQSAIKVVNTSQPNAAMFCTAFMVTPIVQPIWPLHFASQIQPYFCTSLHWHALYSHYGSPRHTASRCGLGFV